MVRPAPPRAASAPATPASRRARPVPGAGRRRHLGRADRRRRRGVAAHLLSPLRVQTRPAVRRLRRRPQWFRTALLERSPQESIIESVQSAIFAFPYDTEAVTQIAALRAGNSTRAHRPAHPATGGGLRRRHRRTALPRCGQRGGETSGCTPSSPRAASPRPSSGRWRCGWSGRTVRSTN